MADNLVISARYNRDHTIKFRRQANGGAYVSIVVVGLVVAVLISRRFAQLIGMVV
jgi:hypothetical protein